ncbi:MAG: glycosyltransferase family 2 protein, partial [bacterium]|nr:glycosyltransferase family 2 protein [bacterium]
MTLLLDLLYIYVVVFSFYFLFLAIKNLNTKSFKKQQRLENTGIQRKLCLIIYAHNNLKNVENIVKQLKEQTYSQENFMTFLVLDNCTDGTASVFASESMLNIFNVSDQCTIGKDQALSILLEKLRTHDVGEAYVFLDANRFIGSDFLSSINNALSYSHVVTGSTTLLGTDLSLRQNIKMAFHKYYTNFLLSARSLMGLATILDSNVFAIKKELMMNYDRVNFKTIADELSLSLSLTKHDQKCVFNPNVKTYIHVDEFDLRIPSLSARLSMFKSALPQTLMAKFAYTEQVYSLISPNVLITLLIYGFILQYSFGYYFIADFTIVLMTAGILILAFALSLVNSQLKNKEFLYLFMYPFYSFAHVLKHFPICRLVRTKLFAKKAPATSDKFVVDVLVTDGRRTIPCKMELISESGLAKVKFMFKNKKFETKTNLGMINAITELVNKLADYGFILKICHCCSNFSQNNDGSTNRIKGFCNKCQSATQSSVTPTLLWNSCECFTTQKQAEGI